MTVATCRGRAEPDRVHSRRRSVSGACVTTRSPVGLADTGASGRESRVVERLRSRPSKTEPPLSVMANSRPPVVKRRTRTSPRSAAADATARVSGRRASDTSYSRTRPSAPPSASSPPSGLKATAVTGRPAGARETGRVPRAGSNRRAPCSATASSPRLLYAAA
ncbi:hypothetical protein GCM10017779_31200 [Streptomyces capillispiralis]|nr:hypothetical protein GCM10017779_31200 [Streptomyces capillispiralis]